MIYTIETPEEDIDFAFDLRDLYKNDCIELDHNEQIESIKLPIVVDNIHHDWYIHPDLDNQWDYPTLSMKIETLKLDEKRILLLNRTNMIKEKVGDIISQMGLISSLVSTSANDKQIQDYIHSGYTDKQIIDNTVNKVLEESLF